MGREYHVSITANHHGDGSKEHPFQTISQAANLAAPSDTVIVHEGTYREWVKPNQGGLSNQCRITYEAAKNEKVIIKGSEIIKDWEQIEGTTVWKKKINNEFFGDYNPYKEKLEGDWFIYPWDYCLHTGDVYLNGMSFYEARDLEEVKEAKLRKDGFNAPWTMRRELILDSENTRFLWYAEVDDDMTTIYANFHEYNPNQELVEINVRKCCFYPEKTGCNYITVRGFEMAQAACPWTPPTADQPGLLGTNWSKGWIIEENEIHDAKCSGISIGKEASTGHNLFTRTLRKPGYEYQMEAVFRALKIGWSKETIGSHIIRNNIIHDCGQNGIVGHLGCIFSEIYDNEIYRIAKKHEYFGYEIAGIKLHAAIDVVIRHNNIHHCSLGTWLDWEAQGTRVTSNLYYSNDRDLMIEVTHGPHLVDNNIFGSEYNLDNVAQGGAYVHNLFLGTMRRVPVLDRATPYHLPHSTDVLGSIFVYSGDDRYYQNVFVGGNHKYTPESTEGTASYNGCPASYEEYIDCISRIHGDENRYIETRQPAYIDRNCYYKDALAYDREENHVISDKNPDISIVEEADGTYLEWNVDETMLAMNTSYVTTMDLGMVRCAEQAFENPDGTELSIDQDILGRVRDLKPVVGPLEELQAGYNRIKVW